MIINFHPELEVVQWVGGNHDEIIDFCPSVEVIDESNIRRSDRLILHTETFDQIVEFGDYIIKWPGGSLIVIPTNLFEAIYSGWEKTIEAI